MKKYLGLALMAAMMSVAQNKKDEEYLEYSPPKEPKKIIPKGCNEYIFRFKYEEFRCIATSQKQADKKFEKWKLKTFKQ